MRYLAAGGGLLLAACAASPERPDGGALAAIALPVFVAFKAAGCAVTIAFAAPGAAVVQLTDRPDRERLVADLERGVAHNCGGRWMPGGS